MRFKSLLALGLLSLALAACGGPSPSKISPSPEPSPASFAPTASVGTSVSIAEAVALVRALDPRFADLTPRPSAGGDGWTASIEGDAVIVVVTVGSGPCPSGPACSGPISGVFRVGTDRSVSFVGAANPAAGSGGSFAGTVGGLILMACAVEPCGSPLPAAGAQVVFTDAAGVVVGQTTADAAGRFGLALAPGDYRVVGILAGHRSISRAITVSSGLSINVEIALPLQ